MEHVFLNVLISYCWLSHSQELQMQLYCWAQMHFWKACGTFRVSADTNVFTPVCAKTWRAWRNTAATSSSERSDTYAEDDTFTPLHGHTSSPAESWGHLPRTPSVTADGWRDSETPCHFPFLRPSCQNRLPLPGQPGSAGVPAFPPALKIYLPHTFSQSHSHKNKRSCLSLSSCDLHSAGNSAVQQSSSQLSLEASSLWQSEEELYRSGFLILNPILLNLTTNGKTEQKCLQLSKPPAAFLSIHFSI